MQPKAQAINIEKLEYLSINHSAQVGKLQVFSPHPHHPHPHPPPPLLAVFPGKKHKIFMLALELGK